MNTNFKANQFMTTLTERFQEAIKANNNEDYTTISVRSSVELAAMVHAMSIATQQAIVNMFTTDLSHSLASYLLEDKKNMDLIKQVLADEYEKKGSRLSETIKGSCFDVLQKEGNLNIKFDWDFSDFNKECADLDKKKEELNEKVPDAK